MVKTVERFKITYLLCANIVSYFSSVQLKNPLGALFLFSSITFHWYKYSPFSLFFISFCCSDLPTRLYSFFQTYIFYISLSCSLYISELTVFTGSKMCICFCSFCWVFNFRLIIKLCFYLCIDMFLV